MEEAYSEREQRWLAWRRKGIGSSDVAAMASGKYGGMYSVVASKLGLDTGDTIDPQLADRGHRWEKPIADAFHILSGFFVHGEQMMLEHPANPVHRCTLDGLLDRRSEINGPADAEAVNELKTEGLGHTIRESTHVYRRKQCQWAMHVTGKQRAALVVARIDDTDDTFKNLHVDWIERDDFEIGELVEFADEAWALVQGGRLPEPDEFTEAAAVRAVNAKTLPEDDREKVDLSDLSAQVARYQTVVAAQKDLKAEREQLESVFRDRIGSNTEGVAGVFEVRIGEPIRKFNSRSAAEAADMYPEHTKAVCDRDALKAAAPSVYEELKQETDDRRITIKESKRGN